VLHVHRSARADRLVDALAEVLRTPPADPFSAEVVAVPAKGVERWVTQRLSHVLGATGGHADGVCAHVRFPSPTRLVREVLAAAGGGRPDDDPWEPDRLLWTLVEVVHDCAGEPWCAALAGAVGLGAAGGSDDTRRGRRVTTVQHLTRLFASYGEHRPAMLRDWAAGDDTDGAGRRLPADLLWQAELWRRLRERLDVASPAEWLPQACTALREEELPTRLELPERLSLFGPTRLGTDALEVLAALGHRREVHLWLPHPSPALWERVRAAAPASAPVRRRADPTAVVAQHPLLASLSHDARELQLQLAACPVETTDDHVGADDRPATLLGHLQRALQDDDAAAPRPLLAEGDRSVQVHACHGPARQVEVLREVLVGLLADDPTLEPRDVLVMCPDIEDYAPLISATFGLEDDTGRASHPGHRLRVRLADRSLRQTSPLLATVATLLELADARVTATQVLDLAGSAPVRRRFGFDDDDLDLLRTWVARSGVRWGLDAPHRRRFALHAVPQNTWTAGLDRILLGAAMAGGEAGEDDTWLGLALPLDDVDSGDIELAGRLAELVDRLHAVLDRLDGEHPLQEWVAHLSAALDVLTAVPEADAWQAAQARGELGQVLTDAGERAGSVRLSLADVRAVLADRLRGRPTRANFRTGTLTMCSMVPMRSVPHRVVCLLGLDDGAFPRSSGIDGDDVLARDPCVGERDPRREDRQLLLDAVLAAGEHLVVLHTGADPRTNVRRPPAVPVGEILDAVDATVRTADGSPARERVVVHHPLQPFDVRSFQPGRLGVPGPFSFDRHALRGAQRAVQPRAAPAPFLAAPLPVAVGDAGRGVDNLVSFLEHPVRGFLRQRLAVGVLREEEELADALCVQMDQLAQWAVGDRLLQARLRGLDAETCQQAEWRRGALPPGALGSRVLGRLSAQVEPLVAATAAVRAEPERSVDVSVDLPGGPVPGTVGSVHGDALVRVVYSRLGPKHRLRAWVQLLALAAARPDTGWTAVTVGRGAKGTVQRSTLGPLPAGVARAALADLVALREQGLRAPLPVAVRTSATYAAARRTMTVANALAKADQDWTGGSFPGEQDDAAQRLVWGDGAPLSVLLAEQVPLDARGETTAFGALSRRLWEPVLAAEQVDVLPADAA
jgi:exodeoxyribonuclease V gamma subunit